MKVTNRHEGRKWFAANHSILNEDGREIAYLREVTAPKGEDQLANCKLMASAPALVEALIGMAQVAAANEEIKERAISWKGSAKELDQQCREYAVNHWPEYLTTSARAVLTKAGVITD